jgi:hypothetical protein
MALLRLDSREQALDLLRKITGNTLAGLGQKSKLGTDRLWRSFRGRRRLSDREVLTVFAALTSDIPEAPRGRKGR